MSKYYTEEIFQFWEKECAHYHWEIKEDPDGLDNINVVYVEHINKFERPKETVISVPMEIIEDVCEAMRKTKLKLENESNKK